MSIQHLCKLFFLRPTLGQGGADRVTLTLLRYLNQERFELSLVLLNRDGVLMEDLPPDVCMHVLDASNVLTAWWPLSRLLRQHQPDVLFSTSSGTNVTAVWASQLARYTGRVLLSERNVLFHGQKTWKRRLMTTFKRFTYERADLVTAVSQGVKDDLMARLHLPPDKIQVVYNPILTPDLRPLADEPISHPWFAENTPIILGVGRLVPEKDFATLLRAFALVRAQRPCRLLILGEGDGRTELLQLAQTLGIAPDVDLPGFDKNPFKYMAGCTAFVLSSRFEGLPGVLIQAMACGAPVIATDCPSGPAEIITADGQDGFLTLVGDAQAIAEKILFLLANPEKREAMGRHGRESAERFRAETVMARYVAAIEGTI